MLRTMILTGTLFAALAAPALAEDGGVVGGAVARLVGGGENAQVVVDQVTATQAPRLARPGWGVGSGWGTVEYLEPVPQRPGRAVTLSGGGDNAEVVAATPAPAAPAFAQSGRAPRG